MGDFVEKSSKVSKSCDGIASRTRSKSSTRVEASTPSTSKKVKFASKGNSLKMESPVENTLNPLTLPEIWDIIWTNLGELEDLKRIRAVSRMWRNNTLNQWRRTAVLILTEEVIQALVEAYLYKKSRDGIDPVSRSPTVDVVDDDEPKKLFQLFDKPFRNFRYPHDSVGVSKMYPLPSLSPEHPARILWEQFFPKAKYLDLETCAIKSIGVSLCGLKWILKRCPGLIRLDFNPYATYQRVGDAGTLQIELFGAESNEVAIASKLETIAIGQSLLQAGNGSDVYINPLLRGHGYASQIEINILFEICPNLKNIWMSSDPRQMMAKAINLKHEFQSLGFVYAGTGRNKYIHVLETYIETVSPPLKSLVLKLNRLGSVYPAQDQALQRILNLARKTLTRLELYYTCQNTEFLEPEWDVSNGGRTTFENLTRLRLHLNYKVVPRFHIDIFNLKSLRHMKKLKEFWFEMGGEINEDFVRGKLDLKIQGMKLNEGAPEFSLPDLKFFHFHQNFYSEVIQLLGKIAPGLKTLEVVLDEENFNTVLETWPKLEQITLLPGSQVPNKLISKLVKIKLRIVNRSQDHLNQVVLPDEILQQERKFCKQTKQATFNC